VKPYYECHITLIVPPLMLVPSILEEKTGWKFSRIDGDPVLGPGVKSYLTRHYPDHLPEVEVKAHLADAVEMVRHLGFEVLREKIEVVIHDSKAVRP
jgi:hypothetical protein